MKRFTQLSCWLLGAAVCCITWTSGAEAQSSSPQISNKGFSIDRFDPSDHGSEWFALDSVSEFGNARPSFGFVLDYARKPLVLVDSNDEEVAGVVSNQMYGHIGGAIVLWNALRFGLNVPVLLINNGDGGTLNGVNFTTDAGPGFGDLRLSADYRFWGLEASPVRLSGGLRVHLPTGSQAAFSGDGASRVTPQIMFAGDSDRIAYAARLGMQFRFRSGDFAGETFGSELQLGLSAGYRLLNDRALLIGPELLAAPSLSSDGNGTFGNANPVELILGAHYDINDEVRVGFGIGPGLASGFGSPSYRILASVEWVAAAVADSDGDGVRDDVDACPSVAGFPSSDPAQNGCPLKDSDGDRIADVEDACPMVAGVPSSDATKHGCPALPDADNDGIADAVDACPAEPGPANLDPARHGCPMAKIDQDQIVIAEQVQFEVASAQIRSASDPVLKAVLTVLQAHPEITKVSVEGHTDNRGGREMNRDLSRDRAAAVVQWLVYNGIDRARLTSVGHGPDIPIADNNTPLGRQKNRRVEFHIITSNPAPGVPPPSAPPAPPQAPAPIGAPQTVAPQAATPAAAPVPHPAPAGAPAGTTTTGSVHFQTGVRP